MELQGADFGDVQIYDEATDTLRIAAHRGVSQEFLEFFETVDASDTCSCGVALRNGTRILVEDVNTDPDWEPYRVIAARTGFRGVQSTPLVRRDLGKPVGMLSTHFRRPYKPTARELRLTDLYARQAADVIAFWLGQQKLRESQARLRAAVTQIDLDKAARLTSMGVLAASIAHEINQPLTAIVTNSEAGTRWLRHSRPNLGEAKAALARIARDANRAGDVIKRIRALVTEGRSEHVPVNVNDAIREVVALMRGSLQEHRVVVRLALRPDLPRVPGDRLQLQQAIMNLVLNAAEAMTNPDSRRKILIRSDTDIDGNLLVSVEDRGDGIDPESAERLFDPFFTTKPEGMGMGLSIVRSVVEAHGGRIWAEPARPNGTVFRFTIPGAETDGT